MFNIIKNRILFIVLLFITSNIIAQKRLADYVVGKGLITQMGATSTTLDIKISFNDETGVFDGTSVDTTCSLIYFNTNDNKAYELPIIKILVVSLSAPVIRVSIAGFSFLNSTPGGQGVIYKKFSPNSIVPFVSGITGALQEVIQRATVLDIENRITAIASITKDTSIVYKYVGNYGVTPALNPPAISFRALNTVGEYYEYSNATWNFVAQMLTNGPQTINGDKNFTGKIAANGVTSNGTATMAAMTTKGVLSQRDTTVSTDFTLDGNYGMIGIDCSAASHTLTMPLEATSLNWIFQIRKEDNSANTLILKRADGTTLYTISSKFSLSFKNKNLSWVRIY